ncbi:MAG: Holliday junction branch migration DNA helicase RuvB [Candidatus Harrisonbacteria bacterium]|nr:Holliday junction branch migration DNA helicase RuvB [Candidatus Harrisonbacteria bacterium]
MEIKKITSIKRNEEDGHIDLALRPTVWPDYVGQEKVKKNLRIILDASKKRGEPCDHLLFYGQAGLGKTTLAYLVAKEMGASLKITSGPTLEKMGDLAAILSNLEKGEVLFIDEAHRLNRQIEEVLYPALESRKLHLVVGKGPGARTLSLDLPPFTLIAATTRANLLSGPLRSRFGASFKLDYYNVSDIEAIVRRSAKLLNVKIAGPAIALVARAARFTPRAANRLLKRVRDYAEVNNLPEIDEQAAKATLEMLEIDHLGLEPTDRQLLTAIIEKFHGGPVGIQTLAAALNDDRGIIEDVYEPYLMSIGLLNRTPAGRLVTSAAYKHLGYKIPEEGILL